MDFQLQLPSTQYHVEQTGEGLVIRTGDPADFTEIVLPRNTFTYPSIGLAISNNDLEDTKRWLTIGQYPINELLADVMYNASSAKMFELLFAHCESFPTSFDYYCFSLCDRIVEEQEFIQIFDMFFAIVEGNSRQLEQEERLHARTLERSFKFIFQPIVRYGWRNSLQHVVRSIKTLHEDFPFIQCSLLQLLQLPMLYINVNTNVNQIPNISFRSLVLALFNNEIPKPYAMFSFHLLKTLSNKYIPSYHEFLYAYIYEYCDQLCELQPNCAEYLRHIYNSIHLKRMLVSQHVGLPEDVIHVVYKFVL